MSEKVVRILLLGDDGVGKTSLILSLVAEEFPEDVPPRAEEITIPADVTPEKVPTHIVDFSTSEQTELELREEIDKANVICVVYSVDLEASMKRITSYWLPIVSEVCSEHGTKPIVLVANKSDLADAEGAAVADVVSIMDNYPEVETCIECSAMELKNISELFYYAQKAVLHPTAPLYSNEEKKLKPKCIVALTRIFMICDADNDDILNDAELNEFQHRCFQSPLPPQGIQEVKMIVKTNTENGVVNDGLSLEGFLFLQKLFIQKGRHETTWTSLRKFGYDDNLDLSESYLCPELYVAPGCIVELSSQGAEFVQELFTKLDRDQDEALSPEELDGMDTMCPYAPFTADDITSSHTNKDGYVTAEGFLALWVLKTYLDYRWAFRHLAYCGYLVSDTDSQHSAVRVTKSKASDIKRKRTNRKVFSCYVFGPPGIGKTSFLQGLLSRSIKERTETDVFSRYAIRLIQMKKQDVHLIMHEVPWQEAEEELRGQQFDSACFLFSNSDPQSFQMVYKLHQTLNEDIPCVFIGSKSDLSTASQTCNISPTEYSNKHASLPLQHFSAVDNAKLDKSLYHKLAALSMHPYLIGASEETSWATAALSITLTITAVATVSFVAYRYWKRVNQKHDRINRKIQGRRGKLPSK